MAWKNLIFNKRGISTAKVNLLDVIPVRNRRIKTLWKGEYIVLAFPRFKHRWMERYLLPKRLSPDIHVTLEERGTAVWQQIDGVRTVDEIIMALAGHFEGEEDYASRVAVYLMQLQKDGFISFKMPTG